MRVSGGAAVKISNQKLAIGIPCTFPLIPDGFFYSYALMEKPEHVFIHADNGPIDTLRNDIVKKALMAGATRLIMLDVDMIYHPQTITRLLSHKLPVVGGLTFRRYPPFDALMLKVKPINEHVNGYESVEEWGKNELIEVDATGAGCLMFDMEIFKKMPRPWFRFQKQEETGSVIGEDIGFCQELKAAGYRIFVDTSIPSDHLTRIAVNEATHRLYTACKSAQAAKAALAGG